VGARPFLKTRFRAIPGREDLGDHWLGGEPVHHGATCPVCKIPLLLLWDINCRDPRFPARKFGPNDRLPLYFCWGCVSDLAYQLSPKGRLRLFRPGAQHEGPSFQYEPYPSHFERRPLALVAGLPKEVLAAARNWDVDDDPRGHQVSKDDRMTLEEYFGHPISSRISMFHSQFGGAPSEYWWRENTDHCANPACPAKSSNGQGRQLSFLAGVLNDPLGGLPMVEPPAEVTPRWWNFFVSVQFQICGKCWTIHACNRSD